MRSSRLVGVLAIGGVMTLSLASVVAVNAAAHSTGAKACETQSGLLSLRHHGRCAAHTHPVSLGARGPQGASGPRGAAGAKGGIGLSGAGPDYQATSEDSFDVTAGGSHDDVIEMVIPAGKFLVSVSGTIQDSTQKDGVAGACTMLSTNSKDPSVASNSFDLPASLGTSTLLPYTLVGTASGPGTLHLKCAANAASGANPSDPYEVDGQANALLLTAIHPAESLGK